jgi:hypothetical protein
MANEKPEPLVNLVGTMTEFLRCTMVAEVFEMIPWIARLIEHKRVTVGSSDIDPGRGLRFQRFQVSIEYLTETEIPNHDPGVFARVVKVRVDEVEALVQQVQGSFRRILDRKVTAEIYDGKVAPETLRLWVHPRRFFCLTPFTWQGKGNIDTHEVQLAGPDRWLARVLLAIHLETGCAPGAVEPHLEP